MGFNLRGEQIGDRTLPWQADATVSLATSLKYSNSWREKKNKQKKNRTS